mgnify:FL=1
MDVKELLKKGYIVLDGAMGTMLQKKGMKMGVVPETLGITKPEWIIDIHKQYIEAGSDVIYANTFGANRYKLKGTGYSTEEIIKKAIENGRKACEGSKSYVALDIGPIGQLLEPTGSLSFEEAYDIFKEEIVAGKDADVIVIETMTDLLETKAAVLAAKENSNLPVFVTMTFEENKRTFTGCSVSAMVLTIVGLGVDAIGVNCSLGPDQLAPIVEEIGKWSDVPVIVKANAGLPDPVTNEYDVTPEQFVEDYKQMLKYGARIFGGCCGTNPDYIRAVKAMLVEAQKNNEFESNRQERQLAICSPINTVVVNQPRIIGERINPTGKKRFKQALVEKDMNYILGQATEQIEAGAEILDVNVGHPEIDEKEMMIKTVKELQSIVSVPLQIDSTKPEVIEAALRVYNGKAIVNSVNGEDKVLDTILPIVKKYGAAVIGLALDENGIPADYKGRVEIAKKILNKALSYGIPKEDIIIDCLVLTVSAEQKSAGETLKALNIVKNELGLRTVLGVSNISFGLPNRELVNKTFLTMALTNGLDLPIMNPNVPSMVWAVRTYKVLADIDKNSMEFISHADEYTEVVGNSKTKEGAVPADNGDANDGKNSKLLKAMEQGLKNEGAELTRAYLENKDAMEIINDMLIPALDVVGDKFEKGKIFLPQLIMAADVAKVCFDEVKNYMSAKGGQSEQKGKIVIATVKGDIHDIGKNIVKVILENYGYNVIDLGRDVDPMKVVEAVKENDVKLVGLSALMTTTLGSMEDTINLLKENNLDCKIMVGGAVLTEDYAMKIGADYYAKDAKRSADIAKEVLG